MDEHVTRNSKDAAAWAVIRAAGAWASRNRLYSEQLQAVLDMFEAMTLELERQRAAHLRAETPPTNDRDALEFSPQLRADCVRRATDLLALGRPVPAVTELILGHVVEEHTVYQDSTGYNAALKQVGDLVWRCASKSTFAATIAAVADALPVEPQIGADVRERVKPMRVDPARVAEALGADSDEPARKAPAAGHGGGDPAPAPDVADLNEAMREMYRDATASAKRAEAELARVKHGSDQWRRLCGSAAHAQEQLAAANATAYNWRQECEAMRAVCEAAQGFYDDYERYELLKKSPSNVTLWDAVDALRAAQGKGQQ